MSGRCGVCAHPERVEIEAKVALGTPVLRVAREYGICQPSLRRHILQHAAPMMREYVEKHAGKVVERVRKLVDRAEKALDRLEGGGVKDKELTQLPGMYREMRQSLELLGKMTGEVQPQSVRALLDKAGAKDEGELIQWCEERKALGEMTLDDYFRDGVNMVRFCLEQRPEWVEQAQLGCFPRVLPKSEAVEVTDEQATAE